MIKEEEKQTLERIITENPEKRKLQQELEKLLNKKLDSIIATEDMSNESSA